MVSVQGLVPKYRGDVCVYGEAGSGEWSLLMPSVFHNLSEMVSDECPHFARPVVIGCVGHIRGPVCQLWEACDGVANFTKFCVGRRSRGHVAHVVSKNA